MILNKERIKELSREDAIEILDDVAELLIAGIMQAGKNCCYLEEDLDELEKTEKIQSFIDRHRPQVNFLTAFEKCQALMLSGAVLIQSAGLRPYLNIDDKTEAILDQGLDMIERIKRDK